MASRTQPPLAPVVIAQLALDLPVDATFDFLAPGLTRHHIGRLACVPFGRRTTIGVIMDLGDTSAIAPEKLRPIDHLIDGVAPLTSADLRMAQFCADYYQHPLGQVLLTTLPPGLRSAGAGKLVRSLELRYLTLSAIGAAADLAALPRNAVAQRRVLESLRPGPCSEHQLLANVPRCRPALHALMTKGWIVSAAPPVAARASGHQVPAPYPLNPEQQAAVARITSAGGAFSTFLLHGVTGSGKTEVYIQAIAGVLARGRQALVLVPEINLTPQLERRFAARFPGRSVIALHSHMNERERLQAWLLAQSGRADIVLGTRLAVFTPMPRLDLIIVDEEHDASFKQQEGLRYSARDVAVYRAQRRQCPIVLGSATPSLETWCNATADASARYQLLTLPRRAVPGALLPMIRLLDLNRHPTIDGVANSLMAEIDKRLALGEQSLIFINRRGYAPALVCQQCGWMPACPHCSARMVFHQTERRLACHHCGQRLATPAHCAECGSSDMAPVGEGTQRIEARLMERFAGARVARIDRDALRARGSAQRIFAQAGAGELDILVGTQMLAKGHDFPNLTLVGVLNADATLFSADFRAPERLFAQLVQVSGRAGRAGRAGEVWIQTRFPDHPMLAAVREQDFTGFAAQQLAERQAAGLPPFTHLVLLRVEAKKPGDALRFAGASAARARQFAEGITLLEAVPATLERKAGWERAQVLAQARSRQALQHFARAWRADITATAPRTLRWALDVDPLEV